MLRTYQYIFIAIITQLLNFAFIGYCLVTLDIWSSILIGGTARIITDGVFVYFSWKGKKVATYMVAFLWGCVAITGCSCILIIHIEKINLLGIVFIILIYSLLAVYILFLGRKK